MDNFYTKVPNTVIRDNSLTCEARLLYCYMLSMEEGWKFYRSAMASAIGVSRQKLNRVVSELVDAGLVERKGQDRGKGGIFSAVNYSVVTFRMWLSFVTTQIVTTQIVTTQKLTT